MVKEKLTLAEIAKMAGVNPSTVSRVLHEDPKAKISSPVREKVLRICNKYNYRPNATARSVASGLSYRVGLILGALEQDLSSPMFSLFVRGICDELQKNNYTLSILWAEQPGNNKDQRIADFLMSDIADGYVLGSNMLDSEITEKLRNMKRPLAYLANNITYHPDGLCGICGTSQKACEQIWKMIPHEHYGKIIYICGKNNKQKIMDIKAAAAAMKIPHDAIEFYDLQEKTQGFPFDRHNAVQWAESHLDLLMQQKLIWCGADLTAFGIGDVLKKNGLNPGKNIGLIGFDNIENSSYYYDEPFLTTIEPHQEKMGRELAELLLQMISGRETEITKNPVEADLVIRQSFK